MFLVYTLSVQSNFLIVQLILAHPRILHLSYFNQKKYNFFVNLNSSVLIICPLLLIATINLSDLGYLWTFRFNAVLTNCYYFSRSFYFLSTLLFFPIFSRWISCFQLCSWTGFCRLLRGMAIHSFKIIFILL